MKIQKKNSRFILTFNGSTFNVLLHGGVAGRELRPVKFPPNKSCCQSFHSDFQENKWFLALFRFIGLS